MIMSSGLNHKLIKEFIGHSGSKVYLKEWPGGGIYVEKLGNTERNKERLTVLSEAGYPVPKIILYEENQMIMEYIHGLDMRNYLIHNNIYDLLHFVTKTLDSFAQSYIDKDYTEVYNEKLNWMNDGDFPFTKKELIADIKTSPYVFKHLSTYADTISYIQSLEKQSSSSA